MARKTSAAVRPLMPPRLLPGETLNVDHVGCPAGEDNRKRLYFTRPSAPTHSVLWYCHNCGEGGTFKHRLIIRDATLATVAKKRERPEDVWKRAQEIKKAMELPMEARRYLQLRHINMRGIPPFIRWSPLDNALAFLMASECDGMNYTDRDWCDDPASQPGFNGVVLRNFDVAKPKYMTYRVDGRPMRAYFGAWPEIQYPVAIVEDILSAHRLWDLSPDIIAYSLNGTHCTVDDLLNLKEAGAKQILVWLDNDNETVTKHALQIAARAHLLGMEPKIERTLHDPKKVGSAHIQREWRDYK